MGGSRFASTAPTTTTTASYRGKATTSELTPSVPPLWPNQGCSSKLPVLKQKP